MWVRTHGKFIVLPHWETGHQHHDLISHSVTLSWHWSNQSIPYPNNAEHLARKWQVSILKVIGFTQPSVWTHDLRHARPVLGLRSQSLPLDAKWHRYLHVSADNYINDVVIVASGYTDSILYPVIITSSRHIWMTQHVHHHRRLYICTYVHTCICPHVYICSSLSKCVHMSMYVWTCVHICPCVYICRHVYPCKYVFIYSYMY